MCLSHVIVGPTHIEKSFAIYWNFGFPWLSPFHLATFQNCPAWEPIGLCIATLREQRNPSLIANCHFSKRVGEDRKWPTSTWKDAHHHWSLGKYKWKPWDATSCSLGWLASDRQHQVLTRSGAVWRADSKEMLLLAQLMALQQTPLGEGSDEFTFLTRREKYYENKIQINIFLRSPQIGQNSHCSLCVRFSLPLKQCFF